MKILAFLLLLAVVSAAVPVALHQSDYGQVKKEDTMGINLYVFPDRYGEATMTYLNQKGFKVAQILTNGGISDRSDDSKVSRDAVGRFLQRVYPDTASAGILVLDWETKTFKDLRNYPMSNSRFQFAENQFLELINTVKELRPNLQVGVYGVPFQGWRSWQRENYNSPGKFVRILSNVDFICPSLYLPYADEEVGRDRNQQYLKDNLNIALALGKQFNKPVLPFFWHRIHPSNDKYGHEIIQKEAFADYVAFIGSHTLNYYGVSGVLLWDDGRKLARLSDLEGVDGWLKKSVHDAASYDAMMIEMANAILSKVESK